MVSYKGKKKRKVKKIPYTPFQREKKLRLEIQLALLREQINRVQTEHDYHCQEILTSSNVKLKEGDKVQYYRDRLEIVSPKSAAENSSKKKGGDVSEQP